MRSTKTRSGLVFSTHSPAVFHTLSRLPNGSGRWYLPSMVQGSKGSRMLLLSANVVSSSVV